MFILLSETYGMIRIHSDGLKSVVSDESLIAKARAGMAARSTSTKKRKGH